MLNQVTTIVAILFVVGCGKPSSSPANKVEAESSKGWVSSGGERYEDSLNPWWLRNVTAVEYCVEVDSQGISINPGRVKYIVAEAIRFWKLEFSGAPRLVNPLDFKEWGFNKIGVGIQEFREVPCQDLVDLRIQFGYRTLTPAQKEYLGDLRKYVGVTVRTHYDQEQLRGRGFIYIASDRGDASVRNAKVPEVWRREGVLQQTVMHELGHVFGIPHDGIDSYLMGQRYPESLLHHIHTFAFTRGWHVANEAEKRRSFFFPEREGETVEREPFYLAADSERMVARKFFGDTSDNFVDMGIKLLWPKGKQEVELRTKGRGGVHFSFGKLTDFRLRPKLRFSVIVRLNPRQRVFTDSSDGDVSLDHVPGPFRIQLSGSALYSSTDGKTNRDVWVTFANAGEGSALQPAGKEFSGIFNSTSWVGYED